MARPNLHIDGYIAYTFGPQVASIYLCSLFKIDDARRVQAIDLEGWPRTFFVTNPMPHCRGLHIGNNRYAWLLDHAIRSGGSVVPQQLWFPQGQGDWRRYVEQATLYLPVFFVSADGSLGVPVPHAAEGLISLRNGNDTPPLGERTTAKIRISVRFFIRLMRARFTYGSYRSGQAMRHPNSRYNSGIRLPQRTPFPSKGLSSTWVVGCDNT
jgi:hypothetical protein